MVERMRLAALGDSLTQGFMNGAISRTSLSYPAIVARTLGLRVPEDFRIPRFPGSGLPINLEDFLRSAASRFGSDLSQSEWLLQFPKAFADFVDTVEDCYERGPGSRPASFGGTYHNLAVWGFRVHDSYTITPKLAEKAIRREEGFIEDDFLGLPTAPMYRTASRVLNPRQRSGRQDFTQIEAIKALITEMEGLDVLILFLGNNDCLGTVLSLDIHDMADHSGAASGPPIERAKRWNLTSAKQFDRDYQTLEKSLAGVLPDSTHVFVGTVPHVTIPPVTRGIGSFDGKYFDYYARFFMPAESFNPWLHLHLTRQDAIRIDERIDRFNKTIKKIVDKHDNWHLVDTCAALDTLAVRRNGFESNPGQAIRSFYAKQGITDHPLLRLDPLPSILCLDTTEHGARIGGGLFSLDCVHPSTIGYGIIAEMFLSEMQNVGIPGADPRKMDWQRIIRQDTLLQSPPALWDDVTQAAQDHPLLWDVMFRVMA